MASIKDYLRQRITNVLDRNKEREGIQLPGYQIVDSLKASRQAAGSPSFVQSARAVAPQLAQRAQRDIASAVSLAPKPVQPFIAPVGKAYGSFIGGLGSTQSRGAANVVEGTQRAGSEKTLLGKVKGIGQAGFGAAQIGSTYLPAASPGRALGFAGAGGVLGGLGSKLTGQDVASGVGSGASTGLISAGITKYTDPLIGKASSAIGITNPLARQASIRGITGLGNIAEDEIISRLEGIKPGLGDRALSFGIGALAGGNDELIDQFLRRNKVPKVQAQEIKKTLQRTRKDGVRIEQQIGKGGFSKVKELDAKAVGGGVIPLDRRSYGGLPGKDAQIPAGTKFVRKGDAKKLEELNAAGLAAGAEIERDEQGNITGVKYDPVKGVAGLAVMGGIKSKQGQGLLSKIPTVQSQAKQAIKTESPEVLSDVAKNIPENKQRKFLQTVLDSKEATPQLKEAVTKIDPQQYTVAPNVTAIKFADDLIAKDGLDKAKSFVLESKKPDQNTTTTGLELMRRYQEQGNYDQAIEVLEALDKQGRDAGRLIQSLSLWNKLSPEGMLRFAQKTFDQANKRFTKLGKVELTPELAGEISTKMSTVQKMADGPEKTAATKEVLDLITSKIPNSVSELIDAYRYQNMLSGPNTQLRNIYGNFFQGGVLRPATLPFEVVNDFVTSTLRGKERTRYLSEVPTYLRTFYGSVPEASKSFWDSMKGTEVDVKRLDLNRSARAKVPAVLTVVPRFMEGMDRFFTTMIRNAETARLMSTGMDEKQALEEANKAAETLLYRSSLDPSNKSGQGYLSSGIDKTVSWIQKSPIPGMRWFIPFISTPTNALKQLIEYTPGVGLANLPGNDKKAQLLAKQMLAGTVAMGGMQLAMEGRATWAAPTDPKEKELFYASGRKPYSIKVGDAWVPMSYFGPLAGAFALPAAVNYYQNESKEALTDSQLSKLTKIAGANLEFISQQSFLQNLGTVVDIMRGDIDASIENTVGFTAGQLVPLSGLVRYINKMVDPVYRKAGGFKESMMKDIPGLSQNLEAYTNPDGTVSTRLPVNLALPFDIGKARGEYDLALEQRQEYNQQRNILNFAKKQLESGKLPSGSSLSSTGGLTTNQEKDFIREKVKLGFDVSEDELVKAYMNKPMGLPKSNKYEKSIRDSAFFSSLSDIQSNEYLTAEQKTLLKEKIASEVGLTVKDFDTYEVAKQDNDVKTLYVIDQFDKVSDPRDIVRLLVEGRKPVNGKAIMSDGVIDNLYAEGYISDKMAKELKAIDYTGTGARKVAKKSGKKVGVVKLPPAPRLTLAKSGTRAIQAPKLKRVNVNLKTRAARQ